jgi:DNA-binding response OmpR family regulator
MDVARILVVEDEFLIRLTLVEALSDAGFAVTEASTGDKALALAKSVDGLALLVTDIQLPGTLDGLALAERLRQMHSALPVIFVTGRPDAARRPSLDRRELYIAKPYLPSEVCAAARRLIPAP